MRKAGLGSADECSRTYSEMISADLAVAKQHALLGALWLPTELEHGDMDVEAFEDPCGRLRAWSARRLCVS